MTNASRRSALQAGAALGLGLAGLPRVATAQEPIKLRMSHFLSPMAPAQTKLFQPWADRVEKDSGGRIKCEIYPAMQLGGKPPQLYDQVRTGVADVIWTVPGYTPGRFPLSAVFELPFVVGSSALPPPRRSGSSTRRTCATSTRTCTRCCCIATRPGSST